MSFITCIISAESFAGRARTRAADRLSLGLFDKRRQAAAKDIIDLSDDANRMVAPLDAVGVSDAGMPDAGMPDAARADDGVVPPPQQVVPLGPA